MLKCMPYETPASKFQMEMRANSFGEKKLQHGDAVGWVDHRRLHKGVLIQAMKASFNENLCTSSDKARWCHTKGRPVPIHEKGGICRGECGYMVSQVPSLLHHSRALICVLENLTTINFSCFPWLITQAQDDQTG